MLYRPVLLLICVCGPNLVVHTLLPQREVPCDYLDNRCVLITQSKMNQQSASSSHIASSVNPERISDLIPRLSVLPW